VNVLVAVPIRSGQLAKWAPRVFETFSALTFPDKELALWPNDFAANGHKYGPNAQARNQLLDKCLAARHSHVLWLDADLVSVPADIIERLAAISEHAIVAPFVYVEHSDRWFYDTGGFVKGGQDAASHWPIWPDYWGGLVELDSVGTCYLAPAGVYRAYPNLGLRYGVTGDEVEHRGLMADARAAGYRVLATDALVVEHANLPEHGEAWH